MKTKCNGDKMQTAQRHTVTGSILPTPLSSGRAVSCVHFHITYINKHAYLFVSGEHFTRQVRMDASQ